MPEHKKFRDLRDFLALVEAAGEPMEVIEGPYTGLPIPAHAEIVREGEVLPDSQAIEGPFGEWTGYYAGAAKTEPVIKIHRVYHRNNPILTCAASQRPPHSHLFERCFIRSSGLWDKLDQTDCPDIKGVWVHEAGSGRTFNVISIRQQYYGHSRQAALVAQTSPAYKKVMMEKNGNLIREIIGRP